jgi:hypothetical protein
MSRILDNTSEGESGSPRPSIFDSVPGQECDPSHASTYEKNNDEVEGEDKATSRSKPDRKPLQALVVSPESVPWVEVSCGESYENVTDSDDDRNSDAEDSTREALLQSQLLERSRSACEQMPLLYKPQHNDSRLAHGDLSHLLDPVTYFSSLDDLELKVAKTCNFTNYKFRQGMIFWDVAKEYQFSQCFRDIRDIHIAFQVLEAEGFCKSQFNILVQDWKRLQEGPTPVARVVPITSSFLTELMVAEVEIRELQQAQHPEIHPLRHATEKVQKRLKALGFDINHCK